MSGAFIPIFITSSRESIFVIFNIFFAPIESIYFKPVNRHQNYISKKIKLCAENKSIKFICLQSLDLAKKEDQEKIFNWMDDILSL